MKRVKKRRILKFAALFFCLFAAGCGDFVNKDVYITGEYRTYEVENLNKY